MTSANISTLLSSLERMSKTRLILILWDFNHQISVSALEEKTCTNCVTLNYFDSEMESTKDRGNCFKTDSKLLKSFNNETFILESCLNFTRLF